MYGNAGIVGVIVSVSAGVTGVGIVVARLLRFVAMS
jgi:hypothetical protein